ncbi:MAG: hypothetical protein AAB262_15230 [Elusimicrobiota bacterium]
MLALVAIHDPNIVLRVEMTLSGGSAVPSDGAGGVLPHPQTQAVHLSEPVLSEGVAFLGEWKKQLERLFISTVLVNGIRLLESGGPRGPGRANDRKQYDAQTAPIAFHRFFVIIKLSFFTPWLGPLSAGA